MVEYITFAIMNSKYRNYSIIKNKNIFKLYLKYILGALFSSITNKFLRNV